MKYFGDILQTSSLNNILNKNSKGFDRNSEMKHFSGSILETRPWVQRVRPHLWSPSVGTPVACQRARGSFQDEALPAIPQQASVSPRGSISITCANLMWNSAKGLFGCQDSGVLCLGSLVSWSTLKWKTNEHTSQSPQDWVWILGCATLPPESPLFTAVSEAKSINTHSQGVGGWNIRCVKMATASLSHGCCSGP